MPRSRYNDPNEYDPDDDLDDSEEGTDHFAVDDEFDYEEFAEREFGDQQDFGDANRPQPTIWQGTVKLIVWLLISAIILGLLAPVIL